MSEIREKTDRILKNSMTVGQLIEELSQYHKDTPVVFEYPYNQRRDVLGTIEDSTIKGAIWSGYTRSLQPIDDGDDYRDGFDDDDQPVEVVVLTEI